jgi:hypothetical protein
MGWAALGGVNGDETPVAPPAAAATNKLGSMMSVTERRMVEFSQTLPELRTSSSLRQSFDNMVEFLDMSALDLRRAIRQNQAEKRAREDEHAPFVRVERANTGSSQLRRNVMHKTEVPNATT